MPLPEHFRVVKIDNMEHLDRIAMHARKACPPGFPSQIFEGEERARKRPEHQLIGQLTTYAASIVLTGSPDPYFERRKEIDKNPHVGDGGVDIIGLENVDIKGSMMRYSQDPLNYDLLVRPYERHDNWVYIHALIPSSAMDTVIITGGWRDQDFPPYPYKGHKKALHGAYQRTVFQLLTLKETEQYIIRS